jgi:two-component system, chemotaxis family, chemotaxis protein CheY
MQRSVIIVDDSSFMTEMLHAFFTDVLDFRVVATGCNGMQAVSLYRQHRPDLLTMDLTMPVKDGKSALREILAEFPDAKVLMITSQLGPPVIDCLKIGAAGYVEKPLMLESREFVEVFTETVNLALAGKGGG